MRFEVFGFKGIWRAEMETAPIALLAGHNMVGKSSTLEAIGAALTGTKQPFKGITKARSGELLHHKDDSVATYATCVVTGDDGSTVTAMWPDCTIKAEGANPPACSLMSAGMVGYDTMTPQQRIELLGRFADLSVTKEDLAAELRSQHPNISDGTIDKVWSLIEATPGQFTWDAAWAHAKTSGTKLKGNWETLTNQNYGEKLAQSWRPHGWRTELEGVSVESVEARVAAAKQEVENLIGASAVEIQRYKDAKALVDTKPQLMSDRAQLETNARKANETLESQRKALADLPALGDSKSLPCPHCDKPILLIREHQGAVTRLEAAAEATTHAINPKLEAEVRIKQQSINTDIQALERKVENFRNEYARLNGIKAQIEQAEELIANSNIQLARSDVDVANAKLSSTERDLEMVRTVKAAEAYLATLAINASIQAALKPDGLRMQRANVRMTEIVEKHLQPLADAAKWGQVQINPDTFDIGLSEYDAVLNSKSELWRARVLMQIAGAVITGDKIVLIDAADILDGPGRNQLFQMLIVSKLQAIIAMTFPATYTSVPKLHAGNLGHSYWIGDDRIAADIADLEKAAEKAQVQAS